MSVILASGSPRRKELLEQMGLDFQICVSDVEENVTKTIPEEIVLELAEQKNVPVAKQFDTATIISADTIVAFQGEILGKPKDEQEAFSMLCRLSGQVHSVFTGVCIVRKENGVIQEKKRFYEETKVEMYPISEEEIKRYIATGEPMDKAGAYGIQGKASVFIKGIVGDYYNVVGLPISRLYQEMK